MKTYIKIFIAVLILINSIPAIAGLDWNKGILTTADGLKREASAVVYDPGGSVYVAGIEENSSGNKFIVTKKYSSIGTVLNSHTNSYFFPTGETINDGVKSIAIDASGNVYVFGTQFGSSSRKNDIVLIKYNSSLTLQWKKLIYNTGYPTASFNDIPCKMAIDASGNIYLSGTWYSASAADDDQIFIRKYSSSGTEVFTTAIAESFITINEKASDMCIDNSSNITVVAKTESNGVEKIVFARVAAAGNTAWIKYLDPASGYSFFEPQIESTSTGTFYISSVLWKTGTAFPYYSKISITKYSSSGIKDWDVFTPEINCYPYQGTLRIDAANNIYAGYSLTTSSGAGPGKYSLFKYTSGGSMLWNIVSPETYTQFLTFEIYASSSLFLSFFDPTAGDHKIRKINAANGSTIWTDNITVSQPSGYTQAWADGRGISINQTTSEVAYCGKINGKMGAPSYATEERWNVRKYGATSPRLSINSQEENLNSEISVETFPNPASEIINIRYSGNTIPDAISFFDIQGKLLMNISGNINIENAIPVSDLYDGVVFIRSEFDNRVIISKVLIQK